MLALLTDFETAINHGLINGLFALALFASFWTGVLNLAPVAIGALTGFGYAALARDHGWTLAPSLALAVVVGAIAGLVIGLVLLRVSSHFLAMATIALLLISNVVVLNLTTVTGGPVGVSVPGGTGPILYIAVLAVASWILSRWRGSKVGLAVDAVREDPSVAASLGIDGRQVRLLLFGFSGAVSGVAGVLMASNLQYIGAETFSVGLAFAVLAAMVLGGAYHWSGALLGAMVMALLPEILARYFDDDAGKIANGIILIAIMIYLPRGLVDPSRWRFTGRLPLGRWRGLLGRGA